MSSQSSGRYTGPYIHTQSGLKYHYDTQDDCLIFETGERTPRPASVNRESFMPKPARSRDFEYTGSPTEDAGYVAGQSGDLNERFSAMTVAGASQAGPSSHRRRRASSEYTPGEVEPQEDERDGTMVVSLQDEISRVQTVYKTGPPEAITAPDLLKEGIKAHKMLLQTGEEGETEELFKSFKVRREPRNYFKVGKVFMVLWVEPAGESNRTLATNLSTVKGTSRGRYGETVFSKVRRFVVIREGRNYCSALPILTYGKRGVGKPGVAKDDHAIIYTGKVAPKPVEAELPGRGEGGMWPDAIRVDPDDPKDKLDEYSRIDFGKVHTIQHNIKVSSYGIVHHRSMNALINQFGNVWHAVASAAVSARHHAVIPGSSSARPQETRSDAQGRANSTSYEQRPQAGRSLGSAGSRGQQRSANDPRVLEGAVDRPGPHQRTDSAQASSSSQAYLIKIQEVMNYHNCSRQEAEQLIDDALRNARP